MDFIFGLLDYFLVCFDLSSYFLFLEFCFLVVAIVKSSYLLFEDCDFLFSLLDLFFFPLDHAIEIVFVLAVVSTAAVCFFLCRFGLLFVKFR
jgi:hypothetical protein